MPGDFDMDAAVGEVSDGLGLDTDSSGGDDDLGLGEDFGVKGADESGEAPITGEPTASDASTAPAKSTAATATTTEAAPVDDYPKTWRKEVSAHWASLPSEVKAEILKREGDIFQGLEGYKADAGIGKSVKSIVAPYESILRSQNLDPLNVINGLMQSHHLLATGTPQQKQDLLQRIIRDYRIEVPGGQAPATGEPPYVDPAVAALQTELSTIKSQLSATEQRQLDTRRIEVGKQVDTFAADPKNIYWAEVADDMSQLLAKGVVGTLQEAYDKAVWLNPVTRAKEVTRTTAEASKEAAAEAKRKADAVRVSTAANVKARAKSGSAATSSDSLDDTLNEAYAEIIARS